MKSRAKFLPTLGSDLSARSSFRAFEEGGENASGAGEGQEEAGLGDHGSAGPNRRVPAAVPRDEESAGKERRGDASGSLQVSYHGNAEEMLRGGGEREGERRSE